MYYSHLTQPNCTDAICYCIFKRHTEAEGLSPMFMNHNVMNENVLKSKINIDSFLGMLFVLLWMRPDKAMERVQSLICMKGCIIFQANIDVKRSGNIERVVYHG